MGEADEDMFWNGIEEFGNVRRECEEGKRVACEEKDNYNVW